MSFSLSGKVHTDEDHPELIEALAPYDEGDDQAAVKLLTPIAASGNVTAIFKLANSYSNLGEGDLAKTLYQLGVDFGDIRCMNNLAGMLNRQGDAEAAFALYEKAAESGAAEPTYNFAVRLKNRGDISAAMKWAEKSLEAGYVRAPALMSIILQSESERFHKLGLEMNSMTSLGLELGQLMAAGDFTEALELVERVNLEDVHNSELHQLGSFCYGAGSLYFLLGQFEDAARYLEMALNPAYGLPADQIKGAQERLANCVEELSTSAISKMDDATPVRDFRLPRFGSSYLVVPDES